MSKTATRYLPNALLQWYAEHGGSSLHRYSDLSGFLLFVDASGFTALTARLAQRGIEGAELLTDFLNRMFSSLDDVVVEWEGDILKFAGDAIWCFLPSTCDLPKCYGQMLHQIEELNIREQICQENPISLHAGASAGTLRLVTLGADDTRLEFEIISDGVMQAYEAAEIAGSSELVIHRSAASGIAAEALTESGHADYFYLTAPNEPLRESNLQAAVRCGGDSEAILRRYIPTAISKRFASSGTEESLSSEHRRITVLFASVKVESDPELAADSTHSLCGPATQIFRIVAQYGATVARVDPFGDSHKFLILFGALVKNVNDDLNALQAAREISAVSSAAAEVRVGLTSGYVFCGEVGSSRRREYTVIGEAVNLAARLMSKAVAGSVFMDGRIASRVRSLCRLTEHHFALKGVGESVPVYELDRIVAEEPELQPVGDFVGREAELGTLQRIWEDCGKGNARTVLLSGDPGIGKTSLCAELVRRCQPSYSAYFSASGSQLHGPGFILQRLLGKLISDCGGLEDEISPIDYIAAKRLVDDKWAPITGELLGVSIEDNEWTRSFSFELRAARAAEIFATLISAFANLDQVIILDDFGQADSYSLAVLRNLDSTRLPKNFLLILSGSFPDKDELSGVDERITVESPGESDLDLLFKGVFVDGVRERELVELIKRQSAGNPLYVRQMLDALIQSGTIAPLSDPHLLEVARPLQEVELPERLEDLELSRIDALEESEREFVKLLAVYGDEFTEDCIGSILSDGGARQLSRQLDLLVQLGILLRDRRRTYRFQRQQAREALYRCLPLTTRRQLHGRIGEKLKDSQAVVTNPRLVYHLSRCDNPQTSLHYSLEGFRTALDRNMLVEAGEYWQRCSDISRDVGLIHIDPELAHGYFRLSCKFTLQEGDYARAYQLTRDWRRYACRKNDQAEYFQSAIQFARLLWLQSRFERLKRILSLLENRVPCEFTALQTDLNAIQSEFHRRQGEFSFAIQFAGKAVSLARGSGDAEKETLACNNLGLALWGAGQLREASAAFEQSLSCEGSGSSKVAQARALNNLSLIAEESGDYIRAEDLLQRSRAIFMELGDRRNASYCSGNLANIVACFGQYGRALELFESADRVFLSLGEEHPHYYTVGNIADLKLILGDSTGARNRYQEVMDFAERVGDKELEAESIIRFADIEFYYGDSEQAGPLYERGIELAEQIGSKEFQIRGLIGLSRMCIGNKQPSAAETHCGRLQEIAEEIKSVRLEYESLFLRGEISRLLGDQENIVPNFRRCFEYAKSQRQFELALKSLLRIYENSPADSFGCAEGVRQLLDRFVQENDDQLLELVRSSGYFQFFSDSIDAIVSESDVGFSRQSVAQIP